MLSRRGNLASGLDLPTGSAARSTTAAVGHKGLVFAALFCDEQRVSTLCGTCYLSSVIVVRNKVKLTHRMVPGWEQWWPERIMAWTSKGFSK